MNATTTANPSACPTCGGPLLWGDYCDACAHGVSTVETVPTVGHVMWLARQAAEAYAAHAVAVADFAADRADYDAVPALAEAYRNAEDALRRVVAEGVAK